jgi:N-acetyl-gamma-glutamyl-phosphate/LysW-gamma-L-alpha-aminoadipyl-6-phosphate reductase
MRAAVLGAAGYTGGELLRILAGHPEITVVHAESRRHAGKPVHTAHPNLRGVTSLRFAGPDDDIDADVVFSALPHGVLAERWPIDAPMIVDLSADFRLRDRTDVVHHYPSLPPHAVEVAGGFTTGLPELFRKDLVGATRISVPGCMATAATLALAPLAGLTQGEVLVDARTGSSGSGSGVTESGQHAERAGALRVYRPTGHRHEAEIRALTQVPVTMTVTGIDAVRGVQVLAHVRPTRPLATPDLWELYRDRYADEPFVRLVAGRTGAYRYPEPKLLSGSNFCDIGFAASTSRADEGRIVVIAALDNLVKGAAGNAVQSVNVAAGFPETAGLTFPGLHP